MTILAPKPTSGTGRFRDELLRQRVLMTGAVMIFIGVITAVHSTREDGEKKFTGVPLR